MAADSDVDADSVVTPPVDPPAGSLDAVVGAPASAALLELLVAAIDEVAEVTALLDADAVVAGAAVPPLLLEQLPRSKVAAAVAASTEGIRRPRDGICTP